MIAIPEEVFFRMPADALASLVGARILDLNGDELAAWVGTLSRDQVAGLFAPRKVETESPPIVDAPVVPAKRRGRPRKDATATATAGATVHAGDLVVANLTADGGAYGSPEERAAHEARVARLTGATGDDEEVG